MLESGAEYVNAISDLWCLASYTKDEVLGRMRYQIMKSSFVAKGIPSRRCFNLLHVETPENINMYGPQQIGS
jgi:hypothetical protein